MMMARPVGRHYRKLTAGLKRACQSDQIAVFGTERVILFQTPARSLPRLACPARI